MKIKIALLAAACLTLAACDSRQALDNVRKQWPGAEVMPVPGKTRKFIVRTAQGEVWYVTNNGITAEDKSGQCLLLPSHTQRTW